MTIHGKVIVLSIHDEIEKIQKESEMQMRQAIEDQETANSKAVSQAQDAYDTICHEIALKLNRKLNEDISGVYVISCCVGKLFECSITEIKMGFFEKGSRAVPRRRYDCSMNQYGRTFFDVLSKRLFQDNVQIERCFRIATTTTKSTLFGGDKTIRDFANSYTEEKYETTGYWPQPPIELVIKYKYTGIQSRTQEDY